MAHNKYKWNFKGKPILEAPKGVYGFTYKVTCEKHPQFGGWVYYGQKSFVSITHPRLSKKGSHEEWVKRGSKPGSKPKKKEVIKESKWQEYKTSSKVLNALIEEHGEENFRFEIIDFATNKSWLTYKEMKLIIDQGALFNPECWNLWVSGKVVRTNLK
jgi:hypothetical protein